MDLFYVFDSYYLSIVHPNGYSLSWGLTGTSVLAVLAQKVI